MNCDNSAERNPLAVNRPVCCGGLRLVLTQIPIHLFRPEEKKPGYLNRLGWINIGPMKTDWPSDGQRPPVAAPISAQHTEPQTAATGRYFHFAASQQAEAAVPYFRAGQHADASNASRQHGDVRRNHRIVPLTSPSVARFIQRRPSLICPSHCGHQSHFVPVGSLLRAACSTNSWRPLFHSELPHSFEFVLK